MLYVYFVSDRVLFTQNKNKVQLLLEYTASNCYVDTIERKLLLRETPAAFKFHAQSQHDSIFPTLNVHCCIRHSFKISLAQPGEKP